MMRSAFVSLIWAVIVARRKRLGGFQMKELVAAKAGDKSQVSRWFSDPNRPNWTLNTFADVAAALDLEIEVVATERSTGAKFAAHGPISAPKEMTRAEEKTGSEAEILFPRLKKLPPDTRDLSNAA
jgi:hypothetical protein